MALTVHTPGLNAQNFTHADSVIEYGGLRHLVDQFGYWVYTVFDPCATIVDTRQDQLHILNEFFKYNI